ncbi:hypothetical protein [Pseudomonas phage PA1C]|uniref:Uncharacterized protein n=2 Tax=root TaxID=1 RepID=A0A5C1K6T9_9CAUD|nr:hypothetical protein PP933_gp068 [Pseudomonas phage vB_PaeM_PS119XW]QBX32219.1 hypothetical protein [Pseudomonas phage PA1C]QEM41797.1 hypothetical protein [Pseudomonas phage vB_PaeM_PS119XW]BEG72707.1 hypothetical protein RVBP21_3350 [Pseudomonas phage BRkr]
MAFTIMEQTGDGGASMFYDPAFRLIVETHINILRNINSVRVEIPNELYWQYEGNFYGYLTEIGIEPELHWIYLRVNGMENPNQFAADVRNPLDKVYNNILIKPSNNEIGALQQFYTSRKF